MDDSICRGGMGMGQEEREKEEKWREFRDPPFVHCRLRKKHVF